MFKTIQIRRFEEKFPKNKIINKNLKKIKNKIRKPDKFEMLIIRSKEIL